MSVFFVLIKKSDLGEHVLKMLRGMEFSMVTTETQIYILIYWLIFIYESSEYQGVTTRSVWNL